uniref:C-type lectin domain-containing protein n=1 Tax=Macrostomum lignano TaxID=282301 RepID=A0A1I8J8U7_9PLAT
MFRSTANDTVAVLNVTKNSSDCWLQVQQNLTASHFPLHKKAKDRCVSLMTTAAGSELLDFTSCNKRLPLLIRFPETADGSP